MWKQVELLKMLRNGEKFDIMWDGYVTFGGKSNQNRGVAA